MNNLKN